jgi:hypothetical protein
VDIQKPKRTGRRIRGRERTSAKHGVEAGTGVTFPRLRKQVEERGFFRF